VKVRADYDLTDTVSLGSNVTNEQFRPAGAPRAFRVGVEYTMGQKP
jgi:hypothetical protein